MSNHADTRPEPPRVRTAPVVPLPPTNGMTDAQKAHALAAAGRRHDDPEYLGEWESIAAEFRREAQEEADRERAEDGK